MFGIRVTFNIYNKRLLIIEAPKRKGAALANQVNITENHRSQVAQHCQQTTATGTRVTGIGPPFFDRFRQFLDLCQTSPKIISPHLFIFLIVCCVGDLDLYN
jgi:hypothetical protein